ncbi:MAG: thiamine pyrophosphate-dependent enzyme, partial [Terrimicrobiaceae bacterium]|nr:thiamine pyrophosphate-dependent enzyme [Terrimicrobiaceae bacterium]
YTTTGWTALIPPSKRVHLGPDFARVDGRVFSGVMLADMLSALAARVPRREASLAAYRRHQPAPESASPPPPEAPLTNHEIRRQLQGLLTSQTSLVVETGDSWFNGQKLRLPDGCRYHFQMQYGSIGWATGAALGVALAAEARGRRAILLTGDGSFQMSAQELSTMLRYNAKPIIFLINNRGYTIEVEIHDGPYNNTQNWDYAGLVKAFAADGSRGLAFRAATAGELEAAVEAARRHDGLVFIECQIERDDCTIELLEWGSRVASANSRP